MHCASNYGRVPVLTVMLKEKFGVSVNIKVRAGAGSWRKRGRVRGRADVRRPGSGKGTVR